MLDVNYYAARRAAKSLRRSLRSSFFRCVITPCLHTWGIDADRIFEVNCTILVFDVSLFYFAPWPVLSARAFYHAQLAAAFVLTSGVQYFCA